MPPATSRIPVVLLAAALCGALVGVCLGVARAEAADSYASAMRLRAQLDATPQARRTAGQYNQALNAFRAVYHADRADPHADDSVEAVAELLAEQGRTMHDPALLRAAVAQLEFLRRDFGASRFSIPALLSSGEIEARDLHDAAAARQTFTQFLTSYPRSPLAPQARAELRRLGGDVPSPEAGDARVAARDSTTDLAGRPAARNATAARRADRAEDYGVVGAPDTAAASAAVLPAAAPTAAAPTAQRDSSHLEERDLPPSQPPPQPPLQSPSQPPSQPAAFSGSQPAPQTSTTSPLRKPSARDSVGNRARDSDASADLAPESPAEPVTNATARARAALAPSRTISGVPVFRNGGHRLALVTGVRHWSTGSYTRIAVDLDAEVPFEASRVSGPDRIFFDFHGARLAPDLAGRAVTVSDGGFLERIRAAQFSGDVVRVVLDVTDVSDYSAFWLPNPSRLIIDIHGRPRGAPAPVFANAAPAADTPKRSAPAPSAKADRASTDAPGRTRPGTPVPLMEPADAPAAASAKTPARQETAEALASSRAASQPALNPSVSQPQPHTPAARAAANGSPTPSAARAGAPGTFVADTAPPGAPAIAQPRAGDSLAAIAALSQQPSRVRATRAPTTAPVSAVTFPAPEADAAPELPAATTGRRKGRHSADQAVAPAPVPAEMAHAAEPDAMGGRSMVRALGLKINRIVVDAGHGGHDSGTLGPGGIEEKDVVLDVALRLGKLLKQRLGADVTYTRDDDTFIPLETRTAIANKAQADLFISVHANSSPDPSARGVETYYLNFTSSADALEVAARENAVSDESIHQLSDLVKKITLQDKIAESREFATDVEASLYQGLEAGNAGLKDRGVKKAPFVVLIGANMPSILAEISFLTNPEDAGQLREGEYRQRIAEALYKGVARYVRSLSGAHPADTTAESAAANAAASGTPR